ncbi:hypothetical protein AAWM_06028 [Aspergillus awamori]|uniref:Jacalin-type lectin domain-containing protein n=1 Tax=Aspergillus awamori TaxID=105351 RepID=A0A401KUZ6_ASPAW|nr:hypothetical protein AAWM_06028 [Aspergillus awamori]GKZ56757.1 hypothetical protein AnigIFM49718_002032 [Aspergillus niger]
MVIKHWSFGSQNDEGTFSHCQLTETGAKNFPTVKTIEVWHSVLDGEPYVLHGIRIKYTDGTITPIYGEESTIHDSFTFDDGEYVHEMWLGVKTWDNLMGSLSIETNKRNYWKAGPKSEPSSYKVPVHSGFFLGVSGGLIYGIPGQLGFYFLEELSGITVVMDFLAMPDPSSISRIEFDTVHGDNRDGRKPLEIEIGRQETVTNSSTTEETWTEGLGVSVSVSTGFFGIGEASAGTEYTYTETKSDSNTYEESHLLKWNGKVEVDPGDYTVVDLYYYTGHFDVEYKAAITLTGKSGSSHTLERFGNMNGTTSGVATFKQYHVDPNDKKKLSLLVKPREEDLEEDKMPPNTNEPVGGKN